MTLSKTTTAAPFIEPGLYARTTWFASCAALVVMPVAPGQPQSWSEQCAAVSGMGALEACFLSSEPFAVAIVAVNDERCGFFDGTGWDADTIAALTGAHEGKWCRLDVPSPLDAIAAIRRREIDEDSFERLELNLLRVNHMGFVQPTYEESDEDKLSILSPQLALRSEEGAMSCAAVLTSAPVEG